MKSPAITDHKSFQWSLGLHVSILLLGFLPIAHHLMQPKTAEYQVELEYPPIPETVMAGSEGRQARSPVYNEEPEPTLDQPNEPPVPVDASVPVDQTTIAENNREINSDVTAETDSEVTASETSTTGADAETHADGGGNGSPLEGNQDGAAMSGDGGGGDGLEGDGIITRKIIYREDITQVAKISGRVTMNVCIDRSGRVVYVAYDPEKTTITDTQIIKRATYLATRYRYEANYSAPARECGQLTFIFSIEDNASAR